MKKRLRWPSQGSLLLVGVLASMGMANTQPLELRGVLPAATLAGSSQVTVWGFEVYDAKLWVAPGFKASEYERHAFALELIYLRDFTNEAITKRSLAEMQRQPGFPPARLQAWQQLLRGAFPDVRKGDRITGIYRPGDETVFMTNGQRTGVVRDAEFSRLFFGIWLSVHTSEPRLREALLAGVSPR